MGRGRGTMSVVRMVFVTVSLIVGVVVGLAVLIVLAGAVAALFSRWRREKEGGTLDMVAFCLIGAAGLIVNTVVLSVVCCWYGIRRKPLPPALTGRETRPLYVEE